MLGFQSFIIQQIKEIKFSLNKLIKENSIEFANKVLNKKKYLIFNKFLNNLKYFLFLLILIKN